MFDNVKSDFRAVMEMDPAATSRLEVLLTYSNFHAILAYRVAHWLHRMDMPFIARAISQFARFMTGVEIHPGAKIGSSFFIDHGMGVVIGETSEIGVHVTLFQGVTLGGTGKERGKRHPTIGDHVVVGAGAKVLGAIKVGDHVKIGANAVVLDPVPPHSTVVGVPGRVVRVRGKKPFEEEILDHRHMPDPTADMIKQLQRRIDKLESSVSPGSKEPKKNNQAVKAGAIETAPRKKKRRRRKKKAEDGQGASDAGQADKKAAMAYLDNETVEQRQARMARMDKYVPYRPKPKTDEGEADGGDGKTGEAKPKTTLKRRRKSFSRK